MMITIRMDKIVDEQGEPWHHGKHDCHPAMHCHFTDVFGDEHDVIMSGRYRVGWIPAIQVECVEDTPAKLKVRLYEKLASTAGVKEFWVCRERLVP